MSLFKGIYVVIIVWINISQIMAKPISGSSPGDEEEAERETTDEGLPSVTIYLPWKAWKTDKTFAKRNEESLLVKNGRNLPQEVDLTDNGVESQLVEDADVGDDSEQSAKRKTWHVFGRSYDKDKVKSEQQRIGATDSEETTENYEGSVVDKVSGQHLDDPSSSPVALPLKSRTHTKDTTDKKPDKNMEYQEQDPISDQNDSQTTQVPILVHSGTSEADTSASYETTGTSSVQDTMQSAMQKSMESPKRLPVEDWLLRRRFPAQFFTENEIERINEKLLPARHKREVDEDICCKTDVWFGSAPTKMSDVDNSDPWDILTGEDVFQAFSRGDCHLSNPQQRCPPGGSCVQKTRLHTLWVEDDDSAKIKYFNINSHCAYEKTPTSIEE